MRRWKHEQSHSAAGFSSVAPADQLLHFIFQMFIIVNPSLQLICPWCLLAGWQEPTHASCSPKWKTHSEVSLPNLIIGIPTRNLLLPFSACLCQEVRRWRATRRMHLFSKLIQSSVTPRPDCKKKKRKADNNPPRWAGRRLNWSGTSAANRSRHLSPTWV